MDQKHKPLMFYATKPKIFGYGDEQKERNKMYIRSLALKVK